MIEVLVEMAWLLLGQKFLRSTAICCAVSSASNVRMVDLARYFSILLNGWLMPFDTVHAIPTVGSRFSIGLVDNKGLVSRHPWQGKVHGSSKASGSMFKGFVRNQA